MTVYDDKCYCMYLFLGALGVRIKATSEERENERRVLREAKGLCILPISSSATFAIFKNLTVFKIFNF